MENQTQSFLFLIQSDLVWKCWPGSNRAEIWISSSQNFLVSYSRHSLKAASANWVTMGLQHPQHTACQGKRCELPCSCISVVASSQTGPSSGRAYSGVFFPGLPPPALPAAQSTLSASKERRDFQLLPFKHIHHHTALYIFILKCCFSTLQLYRRWIQ